MRAGGGGGVAGGWGRSPTGWAGESGLARGRGLWLDPAGRRWGRRPSGEASMSAGGQCPRPAGAGRGWWSQARRAVGVRGSCGRSTEGSAGAEARGRVRVWSAGGAGDGRGGSPRSRGRGVSLEGQPEEGVVAERGGAWRGVLRGKTGSQAAFGGAGIPAGSTEIVTERGDSAEGGGLVSAGELVSESSIRWLCDEPLGDGGGEGSRGGALQRAGEGRPRSGSTRRTRAPASRGGLRTWHRKELGGPLVKVGSGQCRGPRVYCVGRIPA